ncbi:MAG: hypothetical protein RL637_339 [Pseudomonadota bacterium]|jgi:hypothetical protein
MKRFKITYHYKGRAYSETFKALSKVQLLKNLSDTYLAWLTFTNLEIHKI